MTDGSAFAERIRQRFPEGLTGVLVVGGTRTTYVLERNRHQGDPGHIEDFQDYAYFLVSRYFELISMYYDLGGQNLIIPAFSYQGFADRGPEYARQAMQACLLMASGQFQAFYREQGIDPYFVGIDTLLHLPPDDEKHQLGAQFKAFHAQWDYQPGRRKLIWEIAPIPLFSFWQAHMIMGEAARSSLDTGLKNTDDLQAMHDQLYSYYARAAYGTDIPMPHFYLGSNRNGDLKLHAMLPISLLCGGAFRMYYTPYPTLFMTRETLQTILEDLAFGKPLRSTRTDYGGQLTPELAEAEYQRILELRADPAATVGLTRQVTGEGSPQS
jgi:hypothetical protein